jgi:hypothetical protein
VKLFDAATVKTGTGKWERGWDSDARAASGVSVYLSECDPAVTTDVIGQAEADTDEACFYHVHPYAVLATLRRGTRGEQDDDQAWLARVVRESAEVPVGRGLLLRQGDSDVWLGNPDVTEIPAPVLTDTAGVQKAVSDARAAYFHSTLGLGDPILHVNPGNALALKNAGVLQLDPVTGDDRTVWGDVVVISEGYSDIPGMSAVPPAFFTGPLEITLSEVTAEMVVRAVRQNKAMFQVSMIAAIDTPPQGIVRIGPPPAVTP